MISFINTQLQQISNTTLCNFFKGLSYKLSISPDPPIRVAGKTSPVFKGKIISGSETRFRQFSHLRNACFRRVRWENFLKKGDYVIRVNGKIKGTCDPNLNFKPFEAKKHLLLK